MFAVGLAFFLVSLLCIFYERPTGWYYTPNGPSPAGWRPGSTLIHGREGYGVVKVDKNGYLNPSGQLQDRYILMMGSSHTQGKEVPAAKKYSVLVNNHFAKEENILHTYNIACDGNFLPSLIMHFQAAVQAFPGADAITLEISTVNFSTEELEAALQQVPYIPENSIFNQDQTAGIGTRIKNTVKESLPLLSLIKPKIEAAAQEKAKASEGIQTVPDQRDDVRHAAVLNQAMALIRSETDSPIIFIYHPRTQLNADGTVKLEYDETWPMFQEICTANEIAVIDMGTVFEQWYNEHRQLPYGFANTHPGAGHLNQVGHQLIADTLIRYFEEAAR